MPAAHSSKLVDSVSSWKMTPGQGAVDGGYAFG
jgi:hypothetical protein